MKLKKLKFIVLNYNRLYNYVCYDDCGELNYDGIVYENVDGVCIVKSEGNDNSSENDNSDINEKGEDN